MQKIDWSGIFSVSVTPFDDDLKLDEPRFRELIEMNIADGADGIIIAGSTGEFYTLSIQERARLFTLAVEQVKARIPVLAGIADLRVDDVIATANAAVDAGCQGGLLLPPIYAMPNEREILAFYGAVATQTALPLMLYNSPRRVGVSMSADLVRRLSEFDTIVAIKDSSASIVQVGELIHAVGGRIRIFVGYETMLLAALSMGAHGVVAMAHQVTGSLIRQFYDAIVAQDLNTARRLETDVYAVYRCFQSGSYYAAIKATMMQLERPAGPPRPPLLALEESQLEQIRTIIDSHQLRKYLV